ncbi:MAG: ABC transporter permease [Actinomycetes bacterium]
MSTSLTGTGALVRLALRRDRVLLPVWAVVLVGSAASSASATADLYPTVASRLGAAETINGTPALVALYGRIFDPTSVGSLALFKLSALGPVLLAGLAIVLTVRHTRAEEEAGRLELVGAAVVGRRAPLAAAVAVALLSVVAIGLVTALAMIGAGLPAGGSFALGLGWAGCGAVFCAVAAVTAQLATTGRTANGLAGMVLAAAYVLRAAGDASGPDGAAWLSWLSPVGWAQQMRAFAGERWWVLVLPAAVAAAGLGGACVLAARRDLGAGLLPDRPGAATAATRLRSPLALAFRLQRTALLAWTLSFVLLGGILGAITSSVSSLLASPQAQDLITKLGGSAGLTDAFLAAELGIAAIVATVFGVQAAGRLGAEEVEGHSEAALATAATRQSWALAYVTVSLLGTTVLMLCAGTAAGLVRTMQTHHWSDVGRILAGAVVQLPAIWLVTAIVVAAFGFSPRWVVVGWVALGVFLLLGEIGPVVGLDQKVIDLSPYAHVPRLPGGDADPASLAWLLGIGAVLVVGGLVAFRRRDVG